MQFLKKERKNLNFAFFTCNTTLVREQAPCVCAHHPQDYLKSSKISLPFMAY